MKSLNNFKNQEINTTKFYGGWDGVHNTGSGSINGMDYESDVFFDDNNDGKWGAGESIIFHHTSIQPNRG